jgi:hypothetical protein
VSERLRRASRRVRGGPARPPLGGCRGVDPPVRGFGGSAPEKKNLGRHISRDDIFPGPRDIRWFFGTWFFADGFLFPVKELGFWTNPGHWVRVLDATGSYMYIVL